MLMEEAKRLALELGSTLERMPTTIEEGEAWKERSKRWEQIETVVSALQMCQQIMQEGEMRKLATLCRVLRRWRRWEGGAASGWMEIRRVKGHGPSVYDRWREPGESEIQTTYDGHSNRIASHLKERQVFEEAKRLALALPVQVTKLARPIGAYLRENFFYTFSGFNYLPAFLDLLLQVGVNRIMFSADYPYSSMAQAHAFLEQLPVSPTDKEQIAHGNAERLLHQ